MTTISNLNALQQTLRQFDPNERTIHRWKLFDGRKVEILKGEIDGVHSYYDVVFGRRGDILSARDINVITSEGIQCYMQIKGIVDRVEGIRRCHQDYISQIQSGFLKKVPLLNQDGHIQEYLNVTVIKEWDIETKKETKRVAILKKPGNMSDPSHIWRFTLGKAHTLIEGHFKVVCCFPLANAYYPVSADWVFSNGYPVSCPLSMKTLEQKKEFLNDHSLASIKKINTASHQCIQLSFSTKYQKARSKFNPDVFISPYEWGVTLISYTTSSSPDFCLQFGHAALVIESVRNGKYYAEQAHVCHWPDKGDKALRIKIKEAGCYLPVLDANGEKIEIQIRDKEGNEKKVIKKRFAYLKDFQPDNLKDLYEDLSHSKVWIRKKECVERMLSHIRHIRDKQERTENPLFYFSKTGHHGDSNTHAKIGAGFIAGGILLASWPAALVGSAFFASANVNKEGTFLSTQRPKEQLHNCLSWTVEMLRKAGINIVESLGKYVATVPKVYAQSYLSTLEEPQRSNRKSWANNLRDQSYNSLVALREIFEGGSFGTPRKNYFVKLGRPNYETQIKTKKFIEEKFLKNLTFRAYVKYETRELMRNNTPTGIGFNQYEYAKFVEPIMERIIDHEVLSNYLITKMIRIYNAHLEIREIKKPKDWEVKEKYLIKPKTYYETVENILAHCLKIQLSRKILWSMPFTHHNTVFV